MGGASRRKKKLKKESDFKKPKIKAGKVLPKNTNVTKIDMKTKRLVIKDQLQSDRNTGVLTDQKKRSVDELLMRLSHVNENVRIDAITSLDKILFGREPNVSDELGKHLNQLVRKLSICLCDTSFQVRKCVSSLLEKICCSVSEAKFEGLFDVFVARLCNALTHVDEKIQSCSLQLLFQVFGNYGTLAASAQDKIFPVLVHIVAPLQSGGNVPSGANRVALSLRPGTVNRHVEVLKRVNEYLQTFLSKGQSSHGPKHFDAGISNNNSAPSLFINYFDASQPSLDWIISGGTQCEDGIDCDNQLSTSVITLINALLQIWIAVNQSLPEYTSNATMYDVCLECLHHSVKILHHLIVLNNRHLLKFKVEMDRALLVSNFCRYVMKGYPYWTSLKGTKLNHGVEVNKSILSICSLPDFAKTSKVLAHSEDLLNSISYQIRSCNPVSETDLDSYKDQLNLSLCFLRHCDLEQKLKFGKTICERCADAKLSVPARVALFAFMSTSFTVFEEDVQSLFKTQIQQLTSSRLIFLEMCSNLLCSVVDESIHETISILLFDTLLKETRPDTTFDTEKLFQCISYFGIICTDSSQLPGDLVLWISNLGSRIVIQERLILLESVIRSDCATIWFLKLLINLLFLSENDCKLLDWLKSRICNSLEKLALCQCDLDKLRGTLLEMRRHYPWITRQQLKMFLETYVQ